MTFSREVDDRHRPLLTENRGHRITVPDVGFDKMHAWVFEYGCDVGKIAGVGKFIDDDDPRVRPSKYIVDEIRPDEAGATGNDHAAPSKSMACGRLREFHQISIRFAAGPVRKSA